jgi:hypothetical protein
LLAVFFVLFGSGILFLIRTFIPDLLNNDTGYDQDDSLANPGSRVNITLDNSSGYAIPELYSKSGDKNEMGDIEELVSGSFQPESSHGIQGIDQNENFNYNNKGKQNQDDFEFFDILNTGFQSAPNSSFQSTAPLMEKTAGELHAGKSRTGTPVFTPSYGDDAGLGGLPDFDDMASAFFTGSSIDSTASHETNDPVRSTAGKKPQPFKGDFDPQELAQGLRTVLSKDKLTS